MASVSCASSCTSPVGSVTQAEACASVAVLTNEIIPVLESGQQVICGIGPGAPQPYLLASALLDLSVFSAICAGEFPCGDEPGEIPCSSSTAPFDPAHPVCVALIDDVVAAVIPLLPPGPVGPIGPTGAIGATGDIGLTGLQGLQGLLGPIGLQGLQGLIGLLGPRGPRGFPGTLQLPRVGTEFATLLSILAVQVGRLLQSGSRERSSLPARPQPVPVPAVRQVQLERVAPGGTLQDPVITGSTADPRGALRPVFRGFGPLGAPPPVPPPPPPPPPPPAPPIPPATSARARLLALLPILLRLLIAERQRRAARDQARRIREISLARRDAFLSLERSIGRLLGGRMGFGQAGFFGGLAGGITDILGGLQPFIPVAQQLISPGRAPTVLPGFPGPGLATQPAALFGGDTSLLDLLGFGGGAGAVTAPGVAGGLFRPTMSRIVPVNEFAMIGPDGKCHTWLHATPKGWKINKSNVMGRRRRHHHHPR